MPVRSVAEADCVEFAHNSCEAQVKAAQIIADSNVQVAQAIREATETFKPAVEFFEDTAERIDGAGRFVRQKGPWLLGSVPMFLVGIQAITPDAAKALHRVLIAFGATN